LIPNPIRRVLSSIEEKRVRALLMGGQACVLYGAAEFSRDTDLAILASPANLRRLQAALDDLQARVIAVPPFEARYLRRGHAVHFRCEVMALPDLVQAKKTQHDKDWPMVRRLLEAHFFENRDHATAAQVRFWLRELRTPELLVETARRWPRALVAQARHRPLLRHARPGREAELAASLSAEEATERRADARYWAPLRAELERLRRARPRPPI